MGMLGKYSIDLFPSNPIGPWVNHGSYPSSQRDWPLSPGHCAPSGVAAGWKLMELLSWAIFAQLSWVVSKKGKGSQYVKNMWWLSWRFAKSWMGNDLRLGWQSIQDLVSGQFLPYPSWGSVWVKTWPCGSIGAPPFFSTQPSADQTWLAGKSPLGSRIFQATNFHLQGCPIKTATFSSDFPASHVWWHRKIFSSGSTKVPWTFDPPQQKRKMQGWMKMKPWKQGAVFWELRFF